MSLRVGLIYNEPIADRYTDMGEGATYQSTFLEVGPWSAAQRPMAAQ